MENIEDKPKGRPTTLISSLNRSDHFSFAFVYPNIDPKVKDYAKRVEDACLEYLSRANKQNTIMTKMNIVKQEVIITQLAEKYRLKKEWFTRIILGI